MALILFAFLREGSTLEKVGYSRSPSCRSFFRLLLFAIVSCHISETEYQLDKAYLMEYNHMSFGGPPVSAETTEEADEILQNDQRESDIGNFFSQSQFS